MPVIRAAWGRTREAVVSAGSRANLLAPASWVGPTLGDLAVGRHNNLNLLRFVAASMVLFSHCYPLTGHIADEPLTVAVAFTDFGTLGVIIFFAISGFLIAQSVTRSPSMMAFIRSRALRLLPALALSTAFCVFVLGPIATELPQGAYWTHPQTWRYLFHTIVLDPQVDLPGVFRHNPYAAPAVNGSLWTIPLEVWCYAAIGGAALLGVVKRRWAFNLLIVAAMIGFARFEPFVRLHVPSGYAYTTPYLIAVFFFGAWCFLHRGLVPVSLPVAAMAAVAAIVLLKSPLAKYAFYGGVAYLSLVFAYNPRLRVDWFLRLGDYSYGIYVFAFPAQQFLVWWLKISAPMTLFVLALPTTLALAVISWHLVERPALALKRSGRRTGTDALAAH
ncbi:MAG: acyltransferase family protein [Steroidobacterales bacterium]